MPDNKYHDIFSKSYGEKLATEAQIKWLPVYFNDAGFSLTQAKDYLQNRYGVRNFDELTVKQASIVIDDMKCRKKQIKLELEAEEE